MAKDKKEEEKEDKPKDKEASAEGEAPEGTEGAPPKSKKKKLILILIPVLLIVLGGVGFMVLGGGAKEGKKSEEEIAAEQKEAEKPKVFAFHDLPDILVNLSAPEERRNFLKISISLELEDPLKIEEIKKLEPRIIDKFQVYLRGLKVEDLQGTEAVYRLREELLARVNTTTDPIKINQVLFKEILVQ